MSAYKLLTSNYASEDTLKLAGFGIYFEAFLVMNVVHSLSCFKRGPMCMKACKKPPIEVRYTPILNKSFLALEIVVYSFSSYLLSKKNGQITPSEKT